MSDPARRPVSAASGAGFRSEGKTLRVFHGLNAQIDIEVRPVKMAGPWLFHIQDSGYRSIFEPGEVPVRQEQLSTVYEQPDAASGDVRDFKPRSTESKRI